jgi:hypothetical protein
MIKGYWVPVKPGWYYGCGEFGAEGLDDYNTMKKYYPKEWLPTADTSYWDPSKISQSQTFRFHYMWFNKQANIRDWIRTSQQHQEQSTRIMTEAFRRNNDLISTAIHLFIDAWPAGWMKAIMDVDRQPKPAWYAYKDALTPLALNWRTDRMHYFGGQQLQSELWLCNDLNTFPENAVIKYQIEVEGKVVQSARISPVKVVNGSMYQGTVNVKLPSVKSRSTVVVRASIFDTRGNALHEATQEFSVLPPASKITAQVMAPGTNMAATRLLKDLNIQSNASISNAKTILISDVATYQKRHAYYDSLVAAGKKLVLMNLPEGAYTIGGDSVKVVKPTMGAYYFVSNATSHPLAKQVQERDMKLWYDGETRMIQPMLKTMVLSNSWTPVLITGNTGWTARNAYANAISEKSFGKGSFVVCQVLLNNRVQYNPAALTIAEYLFQ